MTRVCLMLIALAAGPVAPALAQSSSPPARYGYLFGARFESGSGDGIAVGGGGVRLSRSGVSVGGDGVWFAFGRDRAFTNDRLVAGSLNVGYYFGKKTNDARWNVFVSGGPAVMYAVGLGFGMSLGYGVNYWFSQTAGIRVEVRGYTPLNTDLEPLGGIRVGLTLR